MLTDGAPEPEISFYQLYNVERVEVLKGPGGFLYGANPLAGTVNLVRKQPEPGSFLAARPVEAAASAPSAASSTGTSRAPTARSPSASTASGRRPTATATARTASCRRSTRRSPGARASGRRSSSTSSCGDSDFSPDAGLPSCSAASRAARCSRDARLRVPLRPLRAGRAPLPGRLRGPADADRSTLRNKAYYRGLDWLSDGTLLQRRLPRPASAARRWRARWCCSTTAGVPRQPARGAYSAAPAASSHRLLAGVEVAARRRRSPWISRCCRRRPRRPGRDGAAAGLPASRPVAGRRRASARRRPLRHRPDRASPTASRSLVGARFDASTTRTTVTAHAAQRRRGVADPRRSSSRRRRSSRSTPTPGRPSRRRRRAWSGERRPEESRAGRGSACKAELARRPGADDASPSTSSSARTWRSPTTTASPSRPAPALPRRRAGAGGRAAAAACARLFSYAYTDSELTRFAELVAGRLSADLRHWCSTARATAPAFAPEHIAQPLGEPALRRRLRRRRRRALRRRAVHRRGQRRSSSTTCCSSTPRSATTSAPGALARPREPDRRGVRDPRLRLDLGDPGAGAVRRAALAYRTSSC